jgi:hypothetical protein
MIRKTIADRFMPKLLFLLILSLCASCSSTDTDFPKIGFPLEMMNKVIKIKDIPEFGNTHRNNDILALQVVNLNDKTLAFEHDSCFLIFSKPEEDWVIVENSMHYPTEIRVLPPNNISPGGIVLTISPYIPDMSEEQTVRIILLGYYEDAEDQVVGAYLDVTIYP